MLKINRERAVQFVKLAVIITVHKKSFQKEIVKNIKRRGVDNYLMFWDDKGNSQELGSVR